MGLELEVHWYSTFERAGHLENIAQGRNRTIVPAGDPTPTFTCHGWVGVLALQAYTPSPLHKAKQGLGGGGMLERQ